MPYRIYLAGPDVFYPDPIAESTRLKEVCASHGLEGVFPMDAGLDLSDMTPHQAARAIYEANIDLIKSCDGVVANMEAFRGPGMDGGTAFEMGFARALGLPVVGYGSSKNYRDRSEEYYGGLAGEKGRELDPKGLWVEDFDLPDNLMMACGANDIVENIEAACVLMRRLCDAD